MTIQLDQDAVDQFFRDARERHAVYLRRRSGASRPWTSDPVMRQFRITNVFRELDKTTTWLRENVREPLGDDPLVLPAVALARWFNLIRSMETIFAQPSLFAGQVDAVADAAGVSLAPAEGSGPAARQPSPAGSRGSAAGLLPGLDEYPTPWQEWLRTGNTASLEWALRKQGDPWVTGAYMIRTPIGMDKLEGVLSSFRSFWTGKPKFEFNNGTSESMGWREVAHYCLGMRNAERPVRLEQVWKWLRNFYGLGPFMAYELVTDLRHTKLLDRAPDIYSWANPGPGALRGANILIRGANRGRKGRLDKSSVAEAQAVMDQLLVLSRDPDYWPQPSEYGTAYGNDSYLEQIGDVQKAVTIDGKPSREYMEADWPRWELHEVEMWCCETAKLVRTRLGFGRPRGNFEGF